jgi:hypothetical protein
VDAGWIATRFAPEPGYLNTASVGVPPLASLGVMTDLLDGWRRGQLSPPELDQFVVRSREAWASIAGVDPTWVAIGASVSEFVGLVAAALPGGARVVTASNEFTSLVSLSSSMRTAASRWTSCRSRTASEAGLTWSR